MSKRQAQSGSRTPWRIVAAASALLVWASGAAKAYSTHSEISSARSIAPAQAVPGQTVSIAITVTFGAIGSDPLRGFYLTDYVPEELSASAGSLVLDGTALSATRETSAAGADYPGCVTARWIIESPPAWPQAQPIDAGSKLTITYTATIPSHASPGSYSLPGLTWVGMIAAQGDSGDHFGYEETPAVITVIVPPDDRDSDGMPNEWETDNGLDPDDAADASLDPDLDGLSNLDEYLAGTDPNDADSDDDGMPDGWEAAYDLNPVTDDASYDSDGDGFSNFEEYLAGTDPTSAFSKPGGTLELFDDFEDGNDTDDPPWNRWQGSWGVDSGTYHQSEVADNRHSVAGNVGWTDYRVEVRVRMAGSATLGTGPMIRVQDMDNYYLFEVAVGSTAASLWLRDAGSWQKISSGSLPSAPVAGVWYALAVEIEGSRLRCYVEGSLVIEATDGTLAFGQIGLNAGDEAWFDDVRVSSGEAATNEPPAVSASAQPTSGEAPLAVTFVSSATDTDGVVAGYAWTFGDGETSSEQHPTHTFTTPGSYVTTLTVTDNQGATGTANVTVIALEAAAPSIDDPTPVHGGGAAVHGPSPAYLLFLLLGAGSLVPKSRRRR